MAWRGKGFFLLLVHGTPDQLDCGKDSSISYGNGMKRMSLGSGKVLPSVVSITTMFG